MSQLSASQAKMMKNSKLLLVCFLIVIVSLLSKKIVPITGKERNTQTQSAARDRMAATATSETGVQTPDKTSNDKQSQTNAPPPSPPAATVSNNKTVEQASNNSRKCEYEKGQWDECEANGAQQKVMRLKWGGPECKPAKTIRRDCKTKGEVGCKYARGDWSSVCRGGLRVRVDTLVGSVAGVQANELARTNHMKCKPQRRVTKDCRRTCHYTKSGWSECSNGFRTRVLTLTDQVDGRASKRGDEFTSRGFDSEASASNDKQPSAQATTTNQTDNQICVRQKLIRRKCTSTESKTAARSWAQQQQQRENSQQASAASSNLTPAQRRRLKQLQMKQQQQQQQQPPSPVTTTGSPPPPPPTTTTTTTTNKVRATSSGGPSLTSRGGGGGGGSTTSAATTLPVADIAAKTTTAAKGGRR